MNKIQSGTKAPEFTLKNQHGEWVSLSDFITKKYVILYFYPKDETPGCVREACSFRDEYKVFQDAGAEVIGISADTVTSHKAFAQKRQLPFQLLSDPDNKVRKAYGVTGALWGLLPGRETFIIDMEGVIQHRFSSQLQIDRHIQEALQVLQSLKKA